MSVKDAWFRKVCDSYTAPPVYHNGEQLPGFPSDELQANTTGQSGVETLREAFIYFEDCVNTFEALGRPISREHKLLDFGAGWGRITRFFLKELPLSNVYGIDVTDDFAQICKDTFASDNFFACNPFPPTRLENGQFDFVTGYSVFSHLSEKACQDWMAEFSRILVPGGIVAVTTRGRPFFDFCESLKNQGHTGYLSGLSNLFEDFDAARASYDRGEFVHSNRPEVSGGGQMDGSFYGETFIPEQYASGAYAEHFVLEKFLYDESRQTHPIMFFRKK